jgi:hypothetical protein
LLSLPLSPLALSSSLMYSHTYAHMPHPLPLGRGSQCYSLNHTSPETQECRVHSHLWMPAPPYCSLLLDPLPVILDIQGKTKDAPRKSQREGGCGNSESYSRDSLLRMEIRSGSYLKDQSLTQGRLDCQDVLHPPCIPGPSDSLFYCLLQGCPVESLHLPGQLAVSRAPNLGVHSQ